MDEATYRVLVRRVEQISSLQQRLSTWTRTERLAAWYHDTSEDDRSGVISLLIWSSEEDACAWDSLSLIVQQHHRDDEPLPKELSGWAADVMEDATKRSRPLVKKRPRPRLNDPLRNQQRDRFIVIAVQVLVKAGVRPTRRNSKKGANMSACAAGGSGCDVVGEAFGMNYKAVEKIWLESGKPTSVVGRENDEYVDLLHAVIVGPTSLVASKSRFHPDERPTPPRANK